MDLEKDNGGTGWILNDREADGLWKEKKKYLRSTQQGAKALECGNNPTFKKVQYYAKFFLPVFCQVSSQKSEKSIPCFLL